MAIIKHEKIDIVGIKYTLKLLNKPNNIMKHNNFDGYCDPDTKQIVILNTKHKEDVLIHELTHAYFFEMGLEELAHNEMIISVFSIIIYRITSTYSKKLSEFLKSENITKSKKRRFGVKIVSKGDKRAGTIEIL